MQILWNKLMIRVNAGYKRGMIVTIRLTMDPVEKVDWIFE